MAISESVSTDKKGTIEVFRKSTGDNTSFSIIHGNDMKSYTKFSDGSISSQTISGGYVSNAWLR